MDTSKLPDGQHPAPVPGESAAVRATGTIPRLFAEQVERGPDRPALFHNGAETSFARLAARADAIAHVLVNRLDVAPGTRVLVCLDRCPDLVAALLGILKAGAAYVPVNHASPSARIAWLIQNTEPSAVISTPALLGSATRLAEGKLVNPEDIREDAPSPVADRSDPDGLAYIVHTSGSTGQPKGVEGLHRGALNRFRWMWREFPFAPGEVGCLKTTVSFVDSVWEVFGPLLRGVPSLLLPASETLDPHAMLGKAANFKVSRIVLVPSLLRVLLDTLESDPGLAWPTLKVCVSSGESLPVDLVGRFRQRFPSARLLNLYGSSEVSADVTCFDTGALADDHASVPLGTPIDHTRVLVLDEALLPVEDGEEGEICVAGEGLARGYFQAAELTEAAFPTITLPDGRRERIYRTGDLGRILPDGNLAFLGRSDQQIKIRGVRIEPAEIEGALASHPTVDRAHVRAVQTPAGKRLFAYVTAAGRERPDPQALMEHLSAALPASMLPHHIVPLEDFPLTANGKLDSLALPREAPPLHRRSDGPSGKSSPTEAALGRLWGEILGTEPAARDDHFLRMGGDSLGLMALSAAIQRTFGRHLPMRQLIESPTLASVAAAIDAAKHDAEWRSIMTIRAGGRKRPLFLVHGIGGGILWGYRNLAAHLDPERPVHAFSSRGLDGLDEFDTPAAMAAHYVRDMKAVQPEGPYIIGGYCFGGNIAYEMCRQLRGQGEEVSLCLVIDAYPFLHARSGRRLELHSPAEFGRFVFNFFAKTWHLVLMPPPERREHLARMGRWLRWRLAPKASRPAHVPGLADAIDEAKQEASTLTNLDRYSEAQARLWAAHVALHYGWVDAPPSGPPLPLALLRTNAQPVFSDYARDFGWSKLTGGEVHLGAFAGHHDFVFLDPNVGPNAAAVDAILRDLP